MRYTWFIGLLVLFSAVSCGPSRHAIPIEMRYPSKSGVELAGKNLTVAYPVSGEYESDRFVKKIAASFSESLEKDYGTGAGSVEVCSVNTDKGNYAVRDSMISLLMATGADLVFLFEPLSLPKEKSVAFPLKVTLHCYDGMNADDKVISFAGTTMVDLTSAAGILSEADKVGKAVSDSFESQWKMEQYSIAYYDSIKWYEALIKAEQYDWKGAMDIWLGMLDVRDLMKRAALEYNIAVSCYMLGNMELAEEWLDRSDADNKMPTLSDGLRKRIAARKS